MHQTMPAVHFGASCFYKQTLAAFMIVAVMLQVGCAHQKTRTTFGEGPQKQMDDLVADGDVNDPSAAVLHDLAGRLLTYKASHQKLPGQLIDVFGGPESGASTWGKPMLDPASSQPFVYTPASTRQSGLPGRIILYQPKSNGGIGRWALLLNDQSNDGKVVTYVQRVPESAIPVVKTNTTRIK